MENKEYKELLDAARLLLVSIKHGEIVVYLNGDSAADYVGILEKAVNKVIELKKGSPPSCDAE